MKALSRTLWVVALAGAVTVGACGGDSTSPPAGAANVTVSPSSWLAVGAGETLRFTATVRDAQGGTLGSEPVTWTSSDAGVVSVDASGLATAVGLGEATITATAGTASGSAALEVWIPETVAEYVPGTSYFGRRSYVEYIPGELPLVLSAPHGGSLEPSEIPNRSYGTTVTDSNTRQTVLAVRDALVARTGKAPHVIISHLRRTKLDPNRDVGEGAQGNPYAELAWEEFQGFIDIASAEVTERYGAGFYIDLHGHGHAIARAELGYLLSASQLNGSDEDLDAGSAASQSSIRALADASPLAFSALLRGPLSLGGYLEDEGVAVVPGPTSPGPGSADYFTGGYNTQRHGSLESGRTVSGVQIELPLPGIRDTDANRSAFGAALASALDAFMTRHFGFFAGEATP